MKRLVLLDRDGVINHDSKDFIKSPDEWQLIDGVGEAIAKLNQAGVKCAVISNQSGISRKLFTLDALMQINIKLQQTLAKYNAKLEFMLFCPHGPDDECDCRKPKPKLLQEAMARINFKPKNTCFVGDSLRDVQAAHQAEIKPILVRTGNGAQTEQDKHVDLEEIDIFDSLADFVDKYLEKPIEENAKA